MHKILTKIFIVLYFYLLHFIFQLFLKKLRGRLAHEEFIAVGVSGIQRNLLKFSLIFTFWWLVIVIVAIIFLQGLFIFIIIACVQALFDRLLWVSWLNLFYFSLRSCFRFLSSLECQIGPRFTLVCWRGCFLIKLFIYLLVTVFIIYY